MSYQTITRIGEFDYAHRVMNQKFKCFNLHGHRGKYELTFKFDNIEKIGYAIDFQEIKRVGCQWIDDMFDHGTIANPEDEYVVNAAIAIKSKLWLMSLNGIGKYCNPSAENIAKEIFLGVSELLDSKNLKLQKVRLYETPNCFTDCFVDSITLREEANFLDRHKKDLHYYKKQKGNLEYDDRI